MIPRMLCVLKSSVALALCLAAFAVAQAQTPATAAATATIRGHVTDPTGALIAGAKVTVTTSAGTTVTSTTADTAGSFSVSGLAAGEYVVDATYDGFAPFTSAALQLTAGQIKRIDIAMAIEMEQQSVTVSDETPTVSTESSNNASSVVLSNKDLDSFSDDPDELANELSALAGPSAGPNGGEIQIDGFSAGELPPKSSIREIRINSNPFSAEYDRLGFGRIEIFTKPGTDKLHGRINAQGNDSSFNTGNPFTTNIPPYHSYQIGASLSGALSKNASFSLNFEDRNTQNDDVYYFAPGVAATLNSGSWVANAAPVDGSLLSPQSHINFSPRIDLQLGSKNTLTARYQFFRINQSGNIGSTQMPSLASTSATTENSVQLSDSLVINSHIVNETRLQYNRRITSSTPVSNAPSYGAPGFSGGGAGGASNDHSDSLELQNLTTMTAGTQAIKFGMRVRDNRDANASYGGFNGSFNFNSIQGLIDALNTTTDTVSGDAIPAQLNYTTGAPSVVANVFDAAFFFQDDWKFNKFLTLSGGLRFETQNHTADHNDFGPRLAFAYALDGHKDKKQAKTILRGGIGFFYDRFGIGSELGNVRNGSLTGPNTQQQYSISNPTCFDATSITAFVTDPSQCGAAQSTTTSIQQIAPNYHAPTTEQVSASIERQLTKNITLSSTYSHSLGVHQMASRNSNAYDGISGNWNWVLSTVTTPQGPVANFTPTPQGTRPDGAGTPIVNEEYPEAVFKENQLTTNVNARINAKFTLIGFYNLTFANANTGTASNAYNLSQDFGRASFASRNMAFFMGNYTGPWGVTFNPMVMLQSGRPYNITSPFNLTGDFNMSERPALVSASLCQAGTADNPPSPEFVTTSFGCLDVTPAAGTKLLPINSANGPGSKTVNLRISRSFAVGPKIVTATQANPDMPGGGPGGGGGMPGGGGGGMRGGGGGGGGMGGGPGMMMGGGPGGMSSSAAKRKYSLSFSAQVSNVFNDINLSNPSGSVTPTWNPTTGLWGPGAQFGVSTSMAGGGGPGGGGPGGGPGGGGGSSPAARKIYVQASFSF